MSIMKKIDEVRKDIMDSAPAIKKTKANDLADLGREAMFHGIKSAQWKKYMKKFTNNQKELDRLTGKDETFNKSEWGMQCLAYIASNSTCTVTTIDTTGTRRNMNDDMIAVLDTEL
ncbi:hypothetical protein BH10ACI1_BH10ACI1_24710 [soil metagenome]